MVDKRDKKIVIIGAGLAGLSCAYHLKNDYEIYEKEKEPGGLCRSNKVNGFTRAPVRHNSWRTVRGCAARNSAGKETTAVKPWSFTFDFAGHLLHFKTRYVFNLVKRLLNGNLKRHVRNSWIFSKNTYTPYPFQANTYNLPKNIVKECLSGLVCNRDNFIKAKDFYEWMLQKFGRGIVQHFMLPYNLKFWGTHPRNLTCEWLDSKIPLPSLKDSIAGAFGNSVKPWGYNFHFWYPRSGGIEALPSAFAKKIEKINYNYEVKEINLKKRNIVFDNSFTKEFNYIVSSIPLTEIGKIIYPIPKRVKEAIRKLKYLSVFNLNLGLSKNYLADKHWIYFSENKFIFYRLGFFSNFSDNLASPDHTSLYVEVSYSKSNPIKNKRNLLDRIKYDLVKADIISKRDQIVSSCINDIKYAYIIYDHNYNKARRIVLEFLDKNKIFSIGRFGSWRYLSMEESIMDGKNAAESLN